MKKTEIKWTPKRARPAGPRTPGRPAWAFSGLFRSHLLRVESSIYSSLYPSCNHASKHLRKCPNSCQNATCSKIQDKIENGQVRVPSGGLVHKPSRRIYQNDS